MVRSIYIFAGLLLIIFIIGCSADDEKKHQKFIEKHESSNINSIGLPDTSEITILVAPTTLKIFNLKLHTPDVQSL